MGVLLGSAAVVASASEAPVLGWSPMTSPGAYSYHALNPGETASQVFTLTNSGGPVSLAVKVKLTGSVAFAKTADSCSGQPLGSGASCTVTVQFAPASYGEIDTATLKAVSGTTVTRLTLHGKAAKAVTRIASSPGAGGPVGSTVTDTATLSGGSSPTGTITFTLHGPSATADCSGTAVDTERVAVSGDGSYTTATGATPAQAGTYWWTVRYSGDAQNKSAATSCGSEQVSIVPASPGITTSQQPAAAAVGTAVADQATVTGGYSPTGTVTFSLYGNSGCTGSPLFTDTENLSGGSATSASYTATAPGTDYWVASYGGDTNNNPAASGCSDEPVTITRATPAITTSPSAGGPYGTTVTDTATVSGGDNPTGTITFSLYGPSTTAGCSTVVDTEQVTVTGDGNYTTPAGDTPALAGTYWWTASYSGDTDNTAVTTSCGAESVTIQAKLYWADYGNSSTNGTIMESNLDGTGVTTLVTGQNSPVGVAVGNGHLYWAANTQTTNGGKIMEANLNGTGVTTLITGQNIPYGVTVTGSHIYWADNDNGGANGTIMEANLDGTGVTTLVTGQTAPFGVAVTSSHLYWTAGFAIKESNLDGTGVTTLVSGQRNPYGLVVNGSHLYWADLGDGITIDGTIMEANLNGTGVTSLVSSQDQPQGIAVDTTHIYWADSGASSDAIMEANLDGTGVTSLVTSQNTPTGLAESPQ
jgi:hypothetical protein